MHVAFIHLKFQISNIPVNTRTDMLLSFIVLSSTTVYLPIVPDITRQLLLFGVCLRKQNHVIKLYFMKGKAIPRQNYFLFLAHASH